MPDDPHRPEASLRQRLMALAPRFAVELAGVAEARGLAVTDADGSTRPIAIAAVPVILDNAELARRADCARQLASAGVKMARAALLDPALHAEVVGALSPLEAQLARAGGARLQSLVTTRVDFLADPAVRALELNATIPAMQGYSDVAAAAFLDVVARVAAVSDATRRRWQGRGRKNAAALHRALLAGASQLRAGRDPAHIALLCRRNDAQLTELAVLRDAFRALGTDADIVYPDQLVQDGDVWRADGQPLDLVYRHLFVRRLEDPALRGADAVLRLLSEQNARRVLVFNPPASQVEVKTLFSLLSRAVVQDELARGAGLDDDELATIAATVPWTRHLAEPGVRDAVTAAPDAWVLKRAWDYGGRAVFVGRARHDDAFRARAWAAWPELADQSVDWAQVVAHAAADTRGGGFIAQAMVDTPPERNMLCTATGAHEAELFVDYSAYASVGIDVDPQWGGVCRGATSRIVNIVGGGGVVPLIDAETALELEQALRFA